MNVRSIVFAIVKWPTIGVLAIVGGTLLALLPCECIHFDKPDDQS